MGSQRQVSVLVNHWLKTLQTSIAGQYCSGLQRPWTLPVPHLAAIRLFLSDAHKQPQWKKDCIVSTAPGLAWPAWGSGLWVRSNLWVRAAQSWKTILFERASHICAESQDVFWLKEWLSQKNMNIRLSFTPCHVTHSKPVWLYSLSRKHKMFLYKWDALILLLFMNYNINLISILYYFILLQRYLFYIYFY